MEDNSYQNDLFGEDSYEKKARKTSFFNKYAPQRFLPHIKIPIEYTIIVLILVLILVIVAYAVGVEAGKRSLDPSLVEEKVLYEVKLEQLKKDMDAREVQREAEEPIIEEQAPLVREIPLEISEEEINTSQDGGYVIQLASFKKELSAREELNKLRDKGVSAFISESGDWYMVRAGSYPTIEKAREVRELLEEYYTDCYIRKVD